jgi:hypothetical protein
VIQKAVNHIKGHIQDIRMGLKAIRGGIENHPLRNDFLP